MKASDLLIEAKTADMMGLVKAIKITHKPTGLCVSGLLGRSDHIQEKFRLLNKLTQMVIKYEEQLK